MNPDAAQNSQEKSIRLIRPSIVILCGPSASGKSTFAKTHFRPTQIISSDYARALVCDDERDQRFNSQAFGLVHFLVETRLMLNRLCVVDSTALTAQARKDLLSLAKKCQVQSTLIVFNVPLDTCLERDSHREKPVGQAVVARQFQNFEQSKDSIKNEGFDQVVEFHGNDQDKVRIDVVFRPIQRGQRPNSGTGPILEKSGPRMIRRPNGNGTTASFPAKVFVPPPPGVQIAVTPTPGTPAVTATLATPRVTAKAAEPPSSISEKPAISDVRTTSASASAELSKNEA